MTVIEGVFYENLKKACELRGTSVTALLKQMKMGTANGTFWKNGSSPSSDVVIQFSEFLNVSTDYLLKGEETQHTSSKETKLHSYRWNFMENAMLSAVGLPADKSVNIDDTVLKWLADKSQTKTDFFTDGHFETGKLDVQSLKRLAEGYTYYGVQGSESLRADYPEMRTWDENYVYLFNVAVEESTNSEYIAEIFEAFKCYPNEHADLMAYIRQGIDNFEEARKKRLDRRNASMNAQKEETA